MFNLNKDALFSLVKSLSKAEKRSFRLYVNRLQNKSKFIQLFDVLDKLDEYDEPAILRRLPEVKKRHLPNLKRHLYRQLLTSLRLIHITKSIDIEIREQIDFARILYGKGMYMQALRTLEQVKRKSIEHHQDILHLEILEFQKMIEARHITRSRRIQNKMEELLEESRQRSYIAHSSNLFSNFNIQMQGWYIQYGHIKSEEEREALEAYFEDNLPRQYLSGPMTFFEKANLYQAYLWYRYILLDLKGALKYARRWSELFAQNEHMADQDPVLYMRAQYYVLVLLFLQRDANGYAGQLAEFERYYQHIRPQLNENGELVAIVYLNLSYLNQSFITGDYEAGLELIPGIKAELERLGANTDVHRILLFYFKFAYLHFCCGHYEEALDYLNEIIHLKAGHLREDLLQNARLLHLLCHFELENYNLLDYLIPSVRRLFDRAQDLSQLLNDTLHFLEQYLRLPIQGRVPAMQLFYEKVLRKQSNPYEQKAIAYLDILNWLKGHLEQAGLHQT